MSDTYCLDCQSAIIIQTRTDGPVHTLGVKLCAKHASLEVLRQASQLILNRMDECGEWDEGCFYYSGKAAPELQTPIEMLRKALKPE